MEDIFQYTLLCTKKTREFDIPRDFIKFIGEEVWLGGGGLSAVAEWPDQILNSLYRLSGCVHAESLGGKKIVAGYI